MNIAYLILAHQHPGLLARLIRRLFNAGGIVAGFLFMVELEFLGGREKLEGLGPVFSLINYS